MLGPGATPGNSEKGLLAQFATGPQDRDQAQCENGRKNVLLTSLRFQIPGPEQDWRVYDTVDTRFLPANGVGHVFARPEAIFHPCVIVVHGLPL